MNVSCQHVKVSSKIRDTSTGPIEPSDDPLQQAEQSKAESSTINQLQQQVSQLSADNHAVVEKFTELLATEVKLLRTYVDSAIKRDHLVKRP